MMLGIGPPAPKPVRLYCTKNFLSTGTSMRLAWLRGGSLIAEAPASGDTSEDNNFLCVRRVAETRKGHEDLRIYDRFIQFPRNFAMEYVAFVHAACYQSGFEHPLNVAADCEVRSATCRYHHWDACDIPGRVVVPPISSND